MWAAVLGWLCMFLSRADISWHRPPRRCTTSRGLEEKGKGGGGTSRKPGKGKAPGSRINSVKPHRVPAFILLLHSQIHLDSCSELQRHPHCPDTAPMLSSLPMILMKSVGVSCSHPRWPSHPHALRQVSSFSPKLWLTPYSATLLWPLVNVMIWERERRRRLDCQFLKVHLDHLESGVGLDAGQGRWQGEGRIARHT